MGGEGRWEGRGGGSWGWRGPGGRGPAPGGPPATVPMTRLSPAGTGRAQWTSVAGPGDPTWAGDAAFDGVVAGAVDVEGVEGVCVAVGDDPPHAASTSMKTRARPLARTREQQR